MGNFENLKISANLIENLKKYGITEPTAVQEKLIPLILSGKNVFFQSETGTGKTFAYLLPLLGFLEQDSSSDVKLIIVSPTYELASQIKRQIQIVSNVKCALCIGGGPLSRQIELLKEKPKVIIGGAARLLELIHLKKLKVNAVKSLVLDEADRLLSPELRSDTERLLERLPKTIQIIGNSATVSPYTCKTLQNLKFSQKELDFISLPPENILKEKITHWAIFSERRNKIDTLRSFINAEKPQKLIVFSSKTDQVKIIKEKLAFKGIECGLLSAKENKVDRKTTIDRFRSGKIKVLITTDLASRGLDIPNISHVVQMDLPEESDFFVHRAGRTARAGNTGINCVIGDAIEMQNYAKLEKKLKIIVYPKILYKGVVCTPESLS